MSSSHSEPPNSHSYRPPQDRGQNFRGRGRGRKEYNPQNRQDNNYKRSYDDNNYFPRTYQPNNRDRDNGEYREKRPRLKDNNLAKDFNKKQPEISRNGEKQRNTNNDFRPRLNPAYSERPPYVPGGAEMFYQTGRLPTGMYVNNRNLNVDNPHAEEPTNAAADDNNTNELSPNPSVPKSHFLLNILPKSKKQVAVPFLHCNSEKPPPKEPSTSKKSGAKAKTSLSKTSETSAKAITEKEEDGPSLEEIEREFQSFEKKVKKEISDNQNDDSDATQIPSISGREHDTVQLQSSPPISYNQSTDFTSDTLPLNYQFSPAPNTLQRNYLIPDPMGVDAEIMRLNNSIANLRSKKTGLLQQSKELTTRLHRVLTDVEVIDIQIDEMMYKASALRN